MVFTMFGAAMVVNRNRWGWFGMAIGLAALVYMMSDGSARSGSPSAAAKPPRRTSPSAGDELVHFSEVMFFASFFGALFYTRVITAPLLATSITSSCGGLRGRWPHSARRCRRPFTKIGPFWLPTINTALLLSSGVTLTIAHHALRRHRASRPVARDHVLLGATFLA